MSTNIMYEVAYPLSLFLCLKNFILLTLLRLAAVLPLSPACPVGLCWTLCACSSAMALIPGKACPILYIMSFLRPEAISNSSLYLLKLYTVLRVDN